MMANAIARDSAAPTKTPSGHYRNILRARPIGRGMVGLSVSAVYSSLTTPDAIFGKRSMSLR